MKKYIKNAITGIILATTALFPASTQADTILGIYISATAWQPDFSGVMSSDGTNINVQDQLNIFDDSSTAFSVALEHPIPFLPNIKFQQTVLDTTSTTVTSIDIIFDGVTYPTNSLLTSQIDFSHTDYIIYYEILDNWLSLDLGISVMNFNGNIYLESEGVSSNVDLDNYVPAIYAKVSFELPLTGLYAGAEGSVLDVGDASLQDYNLHLGWESDFGLGAQVGYHSFGIEWSDFSDSSGDLTFDGYYASVIYHF